MSGPANKDTALPLMESFYTIQGEGFHQGKAAYFIRLGGCDVGCHWCDVKESWDVSAHPSVKVSEIVKEALKYPSRIAVVTGGEPLMHDLTDLTSQLKDAGFQTHIETSGAYPITGHWDWITFSPKKFKEPVANFGAFADELKVIVYNKSDFEFAAKHAEKVNYLARLYLQPEWDKSSIVMTEIIDFVKKYPQWQISLQSHKYLDIP